MKPTIKLAETQTPDNELFTLSEHDGHFYISVGQSPLMSSRENESELELARLGCQGLQSRPKANLLIGGLGMGFTLMESLKLLPATAKVTVAELLPDVIQWNENFLSEMNEHALNDRRVRIKTENVLNLIRGAKGVYDAILLDVDNGPGAFTTKENRKLYDGDGLRTIFRALKRGGLLAIWSVSFDEQFRRTLKRERLDHELIRVKASRSDKRFSRCIWLVKERRPGFGR